MSAEELWSSCAKWFNEKANSPLYWTYLGFFIAWNWRFFQIVFLEDASLFRRPRIEYLDALVLSLTSIEWMNWLIHLSWRVGPPILLTWVAIKWLPKVHNWAFDIYIENHYKRKLVDQERKVEYEKKVASLTKQEAQAKMEQAEQKQQIEKTKTEEEKWEEEFKVVKKDELFKGFVKLVVVIYQKGGKLHSNQMGDYLQKAPQILAFAGTRNLVDTSEEKGSGVWIQLTEKGKYFYRLSQTQT